MVKFDTPAVADLCDRPGAIVITNDDPGPLPPSTLTYPSTYRLTSLSCLQVA